MLPIPRTLGKKYAGFTLLELLVVIVILAALAAVAVQDSASVQTTTVDTAAQQTLQALRFARQEARRTNSNATVSIDVANGTLRVSQLATVGGALVEKTLTHPLTKGEYRVPLTPASLNGSAIAVEALFRFSDGTTASTIGFDKEGTPGKVRTKTQVHPLQITGNWRGVWQPTVSYLAGDWVAFNNENYDCVSNHNSSLAFALDTSRWTKRTAPPHITLRANGHSEVLNVDPTTGFARRGIW